MDWVIIILTVSISENPIFEYSTLKIIWNLVYWAEVRKGIKVWEKKQNKSGRQWMRLQFFLKCLFQLFVIGRGRRQSMNLGLSLFKCKKKNTEWFFTLVFLTDFFFFGKSPFLFYRNCTKTSDWLIDRHLEGIVCENNAFFLHFLRNGNICSEHTSLTGKVGMVMENSIFIRLKFSLRKDVYIFANSKVVRDT